MKSEYIALRKDGKAYEVRVPYYLNGKRKYMVKSFAIKDYMTNSLAFNEAKKWRDSTKLKVMRNEHASSLTLDEIFEKFLISSPLSLETQKKRRSVYKYIKPLCGDLCISSIKSQDVQNSLNMMVTKCSSAVIRRAFTLWKQIYQYANFNDITSNNPTYKVVPPKGDKVSIKTPQATSRQELDEIQYKLLLLDTTDTKLVAYALEIMYYTGMRPSEVYALTKDSIDRTNRTIFISKAVGSNSTNRGIIKSTKNENSIRLIPYPSELDEVFDLLNNDPLFLRDNGTLLNSSVSSPIIKKCSKTFHPYSLRHQFATDLIQGGADIRTIQELMGHSSSSMTLEYSRTNFDRKIAVINSRKR